MTRLSDSYRSGVTDALASVKLAVDFSSSNPLRWSLYTEPYADSVNGHLSNAAAALKRVGPSVGYGLLGLASMYGASRLFDELQGKDMPFNAPVPQDPDLSAYMGQFR